jgi:predicted RNA binding protein YcfA (HicA-like mRNA interferase family)
MPDVPTVTGEQAIAAFGKFGFAVVRIKGSHHILKKPGHRYNLSVPIHKGRTIKKGTLRSLIEGAGVTPSYAVAPQNSTIWAVSLT